MRIASENPKTRVNLYPKRTFDSFFKSHTMTHFPIRMPTAWQEKFNAIAQAAAAFYNQHLKHQNRQLICLAKVAA